MVNTYDNRIFDIDIGGCHDIASYPAVEAHKDLCLNKATYIPVIMLPDTNMDGTLKGNIVFDSVTYFMIPKQLDNNQYCIMNPFKVLRVSDCIKNNFFEGPDDGPNAENFYDPGDKNNDIIDPIRQFIDLVFAPLVDPEDYRRFVKAIENNLYFTFETATMVAKNEVDMEHGGIVTGDILMFVCNLMYTRYIDLLLVHSDQMEATSMDDAMEYFKNNNFFMRYIRAEDLEVLLIDSCKSNYLSTDLTNDAKCALN